MKDNVFVVIVRRMILISSSSVLFIKYDMVYHVRLFIIIKVTKKKIVLT